MAKAKLKNLDSEDKFEIRTAVTTAAQKKFLASVLEKGEKAESMDELIMKRRTQIGEVVFATALSPSEKRILTSKPAWFRESDEIQFIAWDGTRKHQYELPMAQTRRLPAYMINDRGWYREKDKEATPVYFDAMSAVSLGIQAIDALVKQHDDEMRKIAAEIDTVLGGRVNAQQAMDRWPGLEQVYPKIKSMRVQATQQLVVVTDTLTRTFATA